MRDLKGLIERDVIDGGDGGYIKELEVKEVVINKEFAIGGEDSITKDINPGL